MKVARTVLRGEEGSDVFFLPDLSQKISPSLNNVAAMLSSLKVLLRGPGLTPADADLALLRSALERFVPLSDEVWVQVNEPWHVREVRRGTTLTRVGETERSFGLVLEGIQRLYFTTPEGADVTVAFTYSPNYTGVPDSFFLQKPSAYVLVALTDGRALWTDHASLMRLMDRHRELERWAWRLLAVAGAGRGKREREALTLSAEERYSRLLRESPHLPDLVAQHHLASYLGMTPETLSRIRARLR